MRSGRLSDVRRVSRIVAMTLCLASVAGFPAHAGKIGTTDYTPADWMTGVSLSGAEDNAGKKRLNFDYTYPTTREIDYFVGKGFRTFRIPVLSERLLGPVAVATTRDWMLLTQFIEYAERRHSRVIIDFHQYGSMPSGLIGRDKQATEDFASAWAEVARRLRDHSNVIFGLMDEPHEQSAAEWLVGANAAIAAIRQAGARQLILVPGTHWTGAHSWTETDNASVMTSVKDPANNFVYEVHQYLDNNSSGTTPDVVKGAGAGRLVEFTNWARMHHVKGFLGEFGFAATPEALAEGRALLNCVSKNRDVWIGWTYWAAGPWWGNYMFSVEPVNGTDRPQLKELLRFE
jgi:endoglucanase